MAYRFSNSGGGSRDESLLSPILLSTAATLGASIIVQLATPADPWGKSLRFLKQLGRQVSMNWCMFGLWEALACVIGEKLAAFLLCASHGSGAPKEEFLVHSFSFIYYCMVHEQQHPVYHE